MHISIFILKKTEDGLADQIKTFQYVVNFTIHDAHSTFWQDVTKCVNAVCSMYPIIMICTSKTIFDEM